MTGAELRHVNDYPLHLRQHIINGTVRVMPDYHSGRDETEEEQ